MKPTRLLEREPPALDLPYRHIFISADCALWVAVDEEDYRWARQWLWNYKPSSTKLTDHFYAKRNEGPDRTPIYLHVEIMKRASNRLSPPPRKPIVDHIDGNTLDCRRGNLRWASHKTNRLNIGGKSFLIPPFVQPDLNIPF